MENDRGETVCACLETPYANLSWDEELGMDDSYAEVSVLVCRVCGRHWLRYYYANEAFTASGRWYLGVISPAQLSDLTAVNAKSLLEGLGWYFYGGSFYDGRTGKASGAINSFP